ncbi:hypothetical protein [Mangrovicoccus algicola]|uniref:Uncharacterized protein n=1 Tax=Mangrovicoccus algicola TaxID=2771008 RepID=A0A8J6YX90_9RHOB|nr:hypothetical protein [Mangrovicoccus algicola]MBE3637491.1 hypothetical protein [Mangrovicoccus algicola]
MTQFSPSLPARWLRGPSRARIAALGGCAMLILLLALAARVPPPPQGGETWHGNAASLARAAPERSPLSPR